MFIAGWSSPVARQAHNLSNINFIKSLKTLVNPRFAAFFVSAKIVKNTAHFSYFSDKFPPFCYPFATRGQKLLCIFRFTYYDFLRFI